MRPTAPARGIKGLMPLARQVAPHAFRPVASDSELAGCRVAIDGTLLMQRHFYRTGTTDAEVLTGFCNTLLRLRAANVYPLMVFDHPTVRLALKEFEQLKRRAGRDVTIRRAEIESARLSRLDQLIAMRAQLHALPHGARKVICSLLDQWGVALEVAHDVLTSPASAPNATELIPAEEDPVDPANDPYISDTWLTADDLPDGESLRIAHTLYALRAACLATFFPSGPAFLPPTADQLTLARAEYAAYEAVLLPERASLLRRFIEPASGRYASAAHLVSALHARVRHKRDSYASSARSVQVALYEHAMDLCRAMHIPLFVTGDGTDAGGQIHEAEGFASTLVTRGYADMVASEDSDVVMYEAPLLRGLASGAKMELIDTKAMRTGFFPLYDDSADADAASRMCMQQFALLCGTDFNRTIPGIGPLRAHALIKSHGDIATILAKCPKYMPPEGFTRDTFLAHCGEALSVFQNCPDVDRPAAAIGYTRETRHLPEPNPDALRAILDALR